LVEPAAKGGNITGSPFVSVASAIKTATSYPATPSITDRAKGFISRFDSVSSPVFKTGNLPGSHPLSP
jgi:hypothetical protein